jgi:hypothetical protein
MRKAVTTEQRNALLGLPSAVTAVKTGDAIVNAADWVPARIRAGYLPYFVSGPLTENDIYTLTGVKAFLITMLHVGAWVMALVADVAANNQVRDAAYLEGKCREGKSATCNAVRFWDMSFNTQLVAFIVVGIVLVSHVFSLFVKQKDGWANYLYVVPGKASPLITMPIITSVKIAIVLSIVGLLTIESEDISTPDSSPPPPAGRRLQVFTLDYETFAAWAVVALYMKMIVLGFLEQNTSAALTWEEIPREQVRARVRSVRG